MEEIKFVKLLAEIEEAMMTISMKGHNNNYDWNVDKENLTRLEGNIFVKIRDIVDHYREEIVS